MPKLTNVRKVQPRFSPWVGVPVLRSENGLLRAVERRFKADPVSQATKRAPVKTAVSLIEVRSFCNQTARHAVYQNVIFLHEVFKEDHKSQAVRRCKICRLLAMRGSTLGRLWFLLRICPPLFRGKMLAKPTGKLVISTQGAQLQKISDLCLKAEIVN